MKKVFYYFLKIIVSIVFGVLIYVISAFVLSRVPVNVLDFRTAIPKKNIQIFILSNGVHTDIVLPIKNKHYNWSRKIKFENTIAKDSSAKYLALGWGDKGFYLETPTWADLKFSTAFKAATGLSTTAMHCTFYKEMKLSKQCKSIQISEEDYKNLIDYIENSFQVENNNFLKIETNSVYGKNDAFYEAKGSYSLFHTCNTWANNALKAAHQKAAFWTPYEEGIFYHYN